MSAHWSVEDLSALLDERLPAGRAAEARLHLAGCRECAERFEGLRRSVESLRALARAAPPPELLHRVRHQAASLPVQPGLLDRLGSWWQPLALRPAFAAAFSLVLAAVLGVYVLNVYFGRHAQPAAKTTEQPLEAYLRSGVPPSPSTPSPPPPASSELLAKSEATEQQSDARQVNGAAVASTVPGGPAAPPAARDRIDIGGNEQGREAGLAISELKRDHFEEPARDAAAPGPAAAAAPASAPAPTVVAARPAPTSPAPPPPPEEDVITMTAESPVLDEKAKDVSRAAAVDAERLKEVPVHAPEPGVQTTPETRGRSLAAPEGEAGGAVSGTLREAAKKPDSPALAAAAAPVRRAIGRRTFVLTARIWREVGVTTEPGAVLTAESEAGKAILLRNPGLQALLANGQSVLLRDEGRVVELRPAALP